MSRWLRLIFLGALILGLFAWAYELGNQGTGGSLDELQTIGNGLDVAVLTSDPAVSVATDLTVIPPESWQLTITPMGPQLKGKQIQRGNILILLSGGLRLDSNAEHQLIKAGFPVRNYASKRFPWTFTPAPATTVEVPYAGTSGGGYFTELRYLIGDLPPALAAHTSAGADMAAPSVGQPFIDCPQKSRHAFCAVSQADLSDVIDGTGGWHGREPPGPDPSAVLEALPIGNWSITSASPPPRSQGQAWTWSDETSILDRTIIHFSSTDQQRSSQRDLLWSGVIFGVVGGVVAGWLANLGAIFRRRPGGDRTERRAPAQSQPSGGRRSAGGRPVVRLLAMMVIGILVAVRRLRR